MGSGLRGTTRSRANPLTTNPQTMITIRLTMSHQITMMIHLITNHLTMNQTEPHSESHAAAPNKAVERPVTAKKRFPLAHILSVRRKASKASL